MNRSEITNDSFIERNNSIRRKYSLLSDGSIHIHIEGSSKFSNSKLTYWIKHNFQEIFLPQGYPSSVSSDYLQYQIWDTLQAFCSTISGILTTHAIFKGVGVGDSTATAMSATITWILKDGTGMVGRIGFAWLKGYSLDTDCKKWRLAADIINDVAMCVELLLGSVIFREYSPFILSCSTAMKAIVGVAGGATRASITQHQAIRNNMGDVSAKDGSQETFINLVASLLGVFILTQIESAAVCIWTLFSLMTAIHIFANYKAVKGLNFKTLNSSRLNLLILYYLKYNEIRYPQEINSEESVVPGFGLTDYRMSHRKIYLGCSLENISAGLSVSDVFSHVKNTAEYSEEESYLLLYDNSAIYIILRNNATVKDEIRAYYHALIFAITQYVVDSKQNINNFRYSKIFQNLLDRCRRSENIEKLVYEYVSSTWYHFSSSARSWGWIINHHQLLVDDWRAEWNT